MDIESGLWKLWRMSTVSPGDVDAFGYVSLVLQTQQYWALHDEMQEDTVAALYLFLLYQLPCKWDRAQGCLRLCLYLPNK